MTSSIYADNSKTNIGLSSKRRGGIGEDEKRLLG
jgi:hypothetical protein